ncbi:MAG: T9SS type A sorting domain-containing protein, partial [Bacteroidota bacterium]
KKCPHGCIDFSLACVRPLRESIVGAPSSTTIQTINFAFTLNFGSQFLFAIFVAYILTCYPTPISSLFEKSDLIDVIMIRIILSLLLVFGVSLSANAQVNFTANDKVKTFDGPFGYGSNMGVYEDWNDVDLADIGRDIQVNSFRPALPGWFVDFWGYDIRVDYFQQYKNRGIINNTAFIGYPPESEVEVVEHCPGKPSFMYDNMWLDIWDDGADGSPINEANYYANYVYQLVQHYKFNVKFWEILNEPDFDLVGHSSLPKDDPLSWWNTDPDPCHTGLKAPIQYYVRMLRISYEVIKTVDPEAYVSIAGLGYPSFLDAVLRNTDNPDGGKVTPGYPLKGGAYFDAMCYHSYPHFDGSLRYWSNAAGGFVHTRHSDAAAEGVINKKADFETVLFEYGYDGNTYPQKEWLITESNIPRRAFGEYIGSDEAQRNFIIKTLVGLQEKEIRQFHVFSISERKRENEAGSEFDVMGLFKNLDKVSKGQEQLTDMGVAFKTTALLLNNSRYDAQQTQALQLPSEVGGAAFRNQDGKTFTYVLWARTTQDRSESASAKYSFPTSVVNQNLEYLQWDFGRSGTRGAIGPKNIALSGTPIFLVQPEVPLSVDEEAGSYFQLRAFPNPTRSELTLQFELPAASELSITVQNLLGQSIQKAGDKQFFARGVHRFPLSLNELPTGVYFIQLRTPEQSATLRVVKKD